MSASTAPSPVPPAIGPAPGEPARSRPHRRRARPDPVAGSVGTATRHPRLVLVIGLLLVLVAASGLALGIRTTGGEFSTGGQSDRAEELIAAAGLQGEPVEAVVVTAAAGGALDQGEVDALAADVRSALAGDARIAGVGDARTAADGATAVVPVTLATTEDDDDALQDAAAAVTTAREAAAARRPGLVVGQFGTGSADAEVAEVVAGDFRRAELLAVPVTLAVLVIAFGAGVAALVPVAVGLISVAAALGITAAISQVMAVNTNAPSLVLLIGLAVGVDYALFVLRRAREERAAGLAPRAAVAATATTAVRAVVISGVTVAIAMTGLVVAGGFFTSLGLGTIVVVLLSVIASATVLPALLAVLGDRVEALRMPWRRRVRDSSRAARPSFWEAGARRVVARPLLWGIGATLALIALAVPALGMRTSLDGIESLPDSFQTRTAYEALHAAFPVTGSTVQVVVNAPAEAADTVTAALDATRTDATVLGAARPSASPEEGSSTSADGTVHVLELGTLQDSPQGQQGTVDAVREDLVPLLAERLAAAGVGDAEIVVGGEAGATVDASRWLDGRLPVVIAFVLVLTLVVMALSFGSLSLAVATVGLNLLSVGAAYGLLTLVFQGTWAQGLLGFTSSGAVAAWLPLMLFVVLFGLSMDYHVFVLSRVREARLAGAASREAVVVGLARSAGVVTSAAAVMVAVFSIFGTLSLLEMKQLGVGLAAAVLLDATVVRGVLLPAVLALLGERAHRGPRWLPALHG